MSDDIQDFLEQDKDKFLIINLPPRHGKSYTGTNLAQWIFGKDPSKKIMTASYNETLSTIFARQVRDAIDMAKVDDRIIYSDIFKRTKIKKGQASANLWALVGDAQNNYLATSPTGTATGLGADFVIIDDLIKNAYEAYNERTLEEHWSWFTNTIMQRLEGENWKIIVIMTRWAKGDLAGRILEEYDNVRLISYSAVQPDGSMLCPEILNHDDYLLKIKNMNKEIVEANYNQTPIDVGDKMYQGTFTQWKDIDPEILEKVKLTKKYSYTDTADQGKDNLCTINYHVYDMQAYITDIIYTDAPMEETEEMVADSFYRDKVNNAVIESNNGGRGFARAVKNLLKFRYKSNRTLIKPVPTTKNKEARILTASGWVVKNVIMPTDWENKYPEFAREILRFSRKGKNEHDDGADVLSAIYEHIDAGIEVTIHKKSEYV